MANPTIQELKDTEHFDLVAELDHKEIKEFVMERLSEGGRMVTWYMIYQILMIIFGIFLFTRSIIHAVKGQTEILFYVIAALIFCFTFLIVIHELLHGLAIKFTGAPKVNYGVYWKKFIFYAEADKHVLNRTQFAFIALTPLVVVKIVTLAGLLLFLSHPLVFFFAIVMSAHSLFCAGDIGLLSIFYLYGDSEIFTYDVRAERKSYYYKRIK